MLGSVMPLPKFIAFTDAGLPLVGGLLYAYRAGTNTPIDTWSNIALTVPNAWPVVLDAAGRATVYLDQLSYDFIMKDSLGNTLWGPITVPSTALGQSSGEFFTLGGTLAFVVTDLAYPAGATVDKLHVDSAIWAIDSASLNGSYGIECMLRSADGVVTVTAALVNLSDGAPDTPLVTVTSTSAAGERKVSAAIVFPAGGTVKNYGLKVKVSGANGGYVWQAKIVRL